MPKRLLLVDNNKPFLMSLKENLASLSNVFETDISFSVSEAIKYLVTQKYDLVVTGIEMPKKTGIELLIYLKDMRFPGKVIIMSTSSSIEHNKNIISLGAVDIIPKSFRLEWFKDILLERFREENLKNTTSESLDLVTLLQIMNFEKRTSALQINIDDKSGIIYFFKGEIVHAEFKGLEGENAVLKLITLNKGIITEKKIKKKLKLTVEVPFDQLLMNIMKVIDNLREKQQNKSNQQRKGEKQSKSEKIKEEYMAVAEILKTLKDVNGYIGAGVFTPQGEILGGSTELSGIQFEEAGLLCHDTLSNSKSMSIQVGFGNLDMIQLYSEMGIIFAKCYDDGKLHFHTILMIKNDGNVAIARLRLNSAVEALKEVM